MKRMQRTDLPKDAERYLGKRQQTADKKHQQQKLDPTVDWKSARQTQSMSKVLATLHGMTGKRQRCMYCLDSHGSDIEHFWPKAVYPEHMYQWANLLLCCTHCGRLKGHQFPLLGNNPMLVDPTAENPWDSLDFDPLTGNICARFDVQLNAWSTKGEKTVVPQLDPVRQGSVGFGAHQPVHGYAKIAGAHHQIHDVRFTVSQIHQAGVGQFRSQLCPRCLS